MKVRKIWIAVLCVVIGVVWWVVRPQSLVHVAGIADKAEQITRYSISAVDDDVEQCWVTEPEDMQEIWKALETSKVTFVPKSAKSVTYDGDQIMYHLRIYEGEKPVAELGFLDDGRVLGGYLGISLQRRKSRGMDPDAERIAGKIHKLSGKHRFFAKNIVYS